MTLKERTQAVTDLVNSVKEELTLNGKPIDYTRYIPQIAEQTKICALCDHKADIVGCFLDRSIGRGTYYGVCENCAKLPKLNERLEKAISGGIVVNPSQEFMH